MVKSRVFPANSSVVADIRPSPNYDERREGQRPDMILLHYTGMPDAEGALERLCTPASQVSAHYFVFEDGRVFQLVPESQRAWHAGKSYWAGETDINSCSIGIEIVNPGHDYGYPDFPKRQIAAVTALCRGIQTRHKILPVRVLAHSDVAPSRKQDPGEKFPWRTLYDSGVGHWVKPAPIREGGLLFALGDRNDAMMPHAGKSARIRLRRRRDRNLRFGHVRVRHRLSAPFPAGARRRHQRRVRHAQPCGNCWRSVDARGPAPPAPATSKPPPPLDGGADPAHPFAVSRSDGRRGETERSPGRKVRAPWTNGAG